MFKKRGRFEIVAVFPSGGSIHVTSDKAKSLTLAELVTSLREYADMFERAIKQDTRPIPGEGNLHTGDSK